MPWRVGGVDGFGDDLRRRLREPGEDPARVEPAHPERAEEVLPVDVARPQLRRRRVPAVGHPQRASDAEAALGEVEAVADGTTDAVRGDPADEGRVDASLQDEVLEQPPDLVVGKRGDDCRALAEAAT